VLVEQAFDFDAVLLERRALVTEPCEEPVAEVGMRCECVADELTEVVGRDVSEYWIRAVAPVAGRVGGDVQQHRDDVFALTRAVVGARTSGVGGIFSQFDGYVV